MFQTSGNNTTVILWLSKVRQEFAPRLEKVDVLQGEVQLLKDQVADLEQRLKVSQLSTRDGRLPQMCQSHRAAASLRSVPKVFAWSYNWNHAGTR